MERDFIPIKLERNRFKKILIDDIIYCKAEGSYSVIKTISDEFTFSKCLKDIQFLFKDETFIKVNRSYIINFKNCVELKTGARPELVMIDGEIITPKQDIINKLNNKFGVY